MRGSLMPSRDGATWAPLSRRALAARDDSSAPTEAPAWGAAGRAPAPPTPRRAPGVCRPPPALGQRRRSAGAGGEQLPLAALPSRSVMGISASSSCRPPPASSMPIARSCGARGQWDRFRGTNPTKARAEEGTAICWAAARCVSRLASYRAALAARPATGSPPGPVAGADRPMPGAPGAAR